MTAAAKLSSPASLIPFNDLGYPQLGRHLLTLEQVKDGFVDATVFAGSATRQECWRGLVTYLQLWESFSSRFEGIYEEGENIAKCLWLGGSFISLAKVDPSNVDLVVFVEGNVLDRATGLGIPFKAALDKLASRAKLQARLRVTPTIVPYRYPGTPWQTDHYTREQESYMIKRGGLDDWWTRARPAGVPKGAPTPETGRWVRGYVEVVEL